MNVFAPFGREVPQPTNSMKQSPGESDSRSHTQKVPAFYGTVFRRIRHWIYPEL